MANQTVVDVKIKEPKDSVIYKKTAGDIVFICVNCFAFILFALLCFYPFYYILINTISANEKVITGSIMLIPQGIHFGNYSALKYVNNFFTSVGVTVARTFLGTALMVLVSSFAGYLASKKNMWKRKLWYRFVIVPMYFNAGLIPWYVTMMNLGLVDNFLAYIIPGLVAPFNIIMVKTYIESIPAEIEESARIDGAGIMTIFIRIVLPLCLPILATIAIFGAVGHWNSFQDSLLLMSNKPELFTLQHRLYLYLTQASDLETQLQTKGVKVSTRVVQFTISIVSIVPIVLVYPFMQRYFIKGIMMGAVKG